MKASEYAKELYNKVELYKKALDVLLFFDYEKVHKAMEAIDWTYASNYSYTDNTYTEAVPTIEQIKEAARDIITELIERDARTAETGGFRAEKIDEEIVLSFVLEQNFSEYYERED